MPWKFGWLLFWFVGTIHGLLYLQGWAVQHQTESSHHTSYIFWDSETIDQTNNNIQNTYNLHRQSFAAHLPNRQQAKNQETLAQGENRILFDC